MNPPVFPWGSASPEVTILALVASSGPEGVDRQNLHAAQRQLTQKPREWLDAFIRQGLAAGLLEEDADFLTVPEAVVAAIDPGAMARAAARLASIDQAPLAQRVRDRDEAILSLLTATGRTPQPTASLWENLGGNSHSSLRMLQRDLSRLERQMLVVRHEAGWAPAPRLEPKHFEDRAGAVALNILLTQFRAAIPEDIVASLEPILEKARRRISTLPTEDPRIRWLEALRLAPGYIPEDSPVVRPEVMEVVEKAVLSRSQVWLKYSESEQHGAPDHWEGEVSISHFVLQMPAKPAIVCWESEGGRRHLIQLHDIEEIRLLPGRATWPRDYEPNLFPRQIAMHFGDADDHAGHSRVVMLVNERALRSLQRREIGRGLEFEAVEPDEHGRPRYVATLRVLLGIPTLSYLKKLEGAVILAPALARHQQGSYHHFALERFKTAHPLAVPYLEQEKAESDEAQEDT